MMLGFSKGNLYKNFKHSIIFINIRTNILIFSNLKKKGVSFPLKLEVKCHSFKPQEIRECNLPKKINIIHKKFFSACMSTI